MARKCKWIILDDALLATKIENKKVPKSDYIFYSSQPLGSTIYYPTKRRKIINKLKKGATIYLRVQGTGGVFMKCEYKSKTPRVAGKTTLEMKVVAKYKNEITTKYMFENHKIKAGAECAWVRVWKCPTIL